MTAAVVTLPRRSEVPVADTWDATAVFADDAAWEAEVAAIVAELPELETFKGELGSSPANLVEWFARSEAVTSRTYKAYIYASLFNEPDTADQEAKARVDRSLGLFARVAATLSFAEPELLSIGFPTLRSWVQREPRLALYAHYFDQLERRQVHVRSAEVEEVLGLVSDPLSSASATHGILADADLTFRPAVDSGGAEHQVAQGTIDRLLQAPDRALRRSAWEHYADAHLALKNTMANCLATGVKQNVFLAQARRYPSALEASVSANFIPSAVFHNLIATFKEHLPVWHRYWEVRRRALGQEDIAPYDIWAPLTGNAPQVPFDRALEWVAAGMAPLGKGYVEPMVRGVREQRWVDKYPNAGKRAGAFSSGCQGTPPYLLLNYTDDLESMSTLAHELGHSMHSYFSGETQPFVYSDYSIFVAEVASNFNQALVRAHLFGQNLGRDFDLALINEAMSNFHRYFFLMPTLARFELEIHERIERGEALPAATMMEILTAFFREAYGPGVTIDEERVGITWAQFSTHLYGNFYVYQYATGLSGAHALADRILKGEPGAVEDYLGFLKAGSSGYPLDVLARAGVDLTTPAPVRQTFGVLKGLVDRLEALV
jgi:oligoendopeptidase F